VYHHQNHCCCFCQHCHHPSCCYRHIPGFAFGRKYFNPRIPLWSTKTACATNATELRPTIILQSTRKRLLPVQHLCMWRHFFDRPNHKPMPLASCRAIISVENMLHLAVRNQEWIQRQWQE
jgi:hypothetical protein